MQQADIARIEQELNIQLPKAYKQVMLSFPIAAYAGNHETAFWDDADKLIELNLSLRKGGYCLTPWPARFYALGEDAGGCCSAIDLSDPDHGVFWFDRRIIDVTDDQRSDEKIDNWIARQVKELCTDLVGEGGDPDSTPADRKRFEDAEFKSANWGCVIVVLAMIVVVMVGVYFLRRMS
jgi:hypothetical protein